MSSEHFNFRRVAPSILIVAAVFLMGFDDASAVDLVAEDIDTDSSTEDGNEGNNETDEETEEEPHRHNFIPLEEYGRMRLSGSGEVVIGRIYRCAICGARAGNPVV